MRVAAYCRVSTDKTDQLNSLEAQKSFFERFAAENHHRLVNIYADEGLSGTKTKNRHQFLRLLEDAQMGQFDLVAVKDISRFARNTVDFLQSIRKLKALGIETTFLTANMSVLGNSEFILTIFGALAQEESANTSKRVKFGKRINAEKGRVPNLVYGYDKIPGEYFELSINQIEAAWVQQIYRWYTEQGLGGYRIADLLNDKGLLTKRGCRWSQNAVMRILTNELYTGKINNGKEEVDDFLTGSRKKIAPAHWLVTQRPALRIVSQELFDAAQEVLHARSSKSTGNAARSTQRNSFSGLIHCSACGAAFYRMQRTYQKTHTRWVCSQHLRKSDHSCSNAVTLDEGLLLCELDRFVRQQILLDPRLQRQLIRALTSLFSPCSSQEHDLEKKMRVINKRRERYLDLYAEALISKAEFRRRISVLDNEMQQAQSEQHKAQYTAAQVEAAAKVCVHELLTSLSLTGFPNHRMRQIIRTVDVDMHRHTDIYLLTPHL